MTLTRRRWLFGGPLFAAFILVVGSFALAEALRYAAAPARIQIQATPIVAFDSRYPTLTRFDKLQFRGGLAFVSNDKAFGDVSALHMEPDGSHYPGSD